MKLIIALLLSCVTFSSCDVWMYDEPVYVHHYPIGRPMIRPSVPHRPVFKDGHRNMRPSPMSPKPRH
jgi:hypothetical protein